jgi:hypothetical protein
MISMNWGRCEITYVAHIWTSVRLFGTPEANTKWDHLASPPDVSDETHGLICTLSFYVLNDSCK